VYTGLDFEGEVRDCEEGTLHWIEDEALTALDLWEGDHYFLEWIYSPDYQDRRFSAKFYYQNKTYISHEVEFYGGIK
jgi:8-oxo-dGTP diphosphatase